MNKTEFKNLPDYANVAENLIQKHMDAGFGEEIALIAAKVTLEFVGCNLESKNLASQIHQKAYNYLVGHGKKLHREAILENPKFRVTSDTVASFDYTFIDNSNWCGGRIGNLRFEAKVFDKPSIFGINDGRVSNMVIVNTKGNIIMNYDRGWDIELPEKYKTQFDAIMTLLENAPKRFS